MKKLLLILAITGLATMAPVQQVKAQIPIVDIIKNAIKKVIKAIDLQIQKQQNKVIWLQNAQKTLENTMSKLKLDEITDWVDKQKELYKGYYDELRKVKAVIAYYKRIKDITEKQVHLVNEYKRAWGLFQQDKHFTPDEISYMGDVYSGILDESIKNMDQVFLVINSFQTQMSDAKRLELINEASDRVDVNYNDLKAFNQQGILLSLQRAKAQNDVDITKKLYGIQ
ncbi:conjugal transfer protein TraI [Parasediminibacterium paludis]|uniref:Conjugal transfer protein TraI n=1 Tax=Parasediminibacterium paludis TaxID=908966 RepID=A0ABV8Q1A4_9BACT